MLLQLKACSKTIFKFKMWTSICVLLLLRVSFITLAVSMRSRDIFGLSGSKFKEKFEYNQETFDHQQEGKQRPRFRRDLAMDNIDVLIKALQHVQDVQKQMDEFSKCAENQSVVLDISFDHTRWKPEASLVLEVANLLTSLWRIRTADNLSIAENDTLLYALVRSNVLFSPSVFGSVICFERNQYRHYERFCPYAFRDKKLNGALHVIDISVGHDYLTNHETIWWREPREKALDMTPEQRTEFYSTRLNESMAYPLSNITVPVVTDIALEGFWTRPYFDCFGGKSWMVTFLAPFFNATDHFLGVVSIDIELSDIDINQCDGDKGTRDKVDNNKSGGLLEFLGTHRCKKSTECVTIPRQGFKRGSYLCKCKKGYYFPRSSASYKYFNGSNIEAEYGKMKRGSPNKYNDSFECLKCSEGCAECTDDRKCVYSVSVGTRALLVTLDAVGIVLALGLGILVLANRDVKVFYTSSPLFLCIIVAGAVLMYCGFLILYVNPPTKAICIAFPWLQNMGFVLAYCSLALKTWKVYTTFRVRSPRKVEVTDIALLKHLGVIVVVYVIYLLVWTLTSAPAVEVATTVDKLKYSRCSINWFDYVTVFCNGVLLVTALVYCYRVRNAPSAYSESRYVSWAIYNAIFVICFFAILRGLTRSSTNPDIIFAVEFVFVHMIATVMILLLFIPKCIIIRKMKLRGVSSSFSASKKGTSELTPNGSHMYVADASTLERENDDLKAEVKRLSAKVASLQARLMREANKHIKGSGSNNTWRRDRSGTKEDDGDFVDLRKAPPSPIARFISSKV